MEICFITEQPDVCRLFMERLNDRNHHCFIQDSWIQFERDLSARDCRLSLIVCDFHFVSSCFFNLFEAIRDTGNYVPLIFYNDPVPSDTNRVNHWICQNESGLRRDFPENLVPELEKINQIIMDPSVRKHIPLLQPAVPVGFENLKVSTKNREIDLVSFRRRNHISPVLYKLFKYMYEHRNKEFSMKELSKVLFKRTDRLLKRRNSVYSYISRLRKYLEKDTTLDADIMRTSQGCYELIIY